jgi:hypothetical protein
MPPKKKSSGMPWTAAQELQVFKLLRDKPGISPNDVSRYLKGVLHHRSEDAISAWSRKNIIKQKQQLNTRIAQLQAKIALQHSSAAQAIMSPELRQISDMMKTMDINGRAAFLQYLRSYGSGGGGGGGGGGAAPPAIMIDRYEGLTMAQKMLKKSLQEMADDPKNIQEGMSKKEWIQRQFEKRRAYKFGGAVVNRMRTMPEASSQNRGSAENQNPLLAAIRNRRKQKD